MVKSKHDKRMSTRKKIVGINSLTQLVHVILQCDRWGKYRERGDAFPSHLVKEMSCSANTIDETTLVD
jgi:hypothetical protein